MLGDAMYGVEEQGALGEGCRRHRGCRGGLTMNECVDERLKDTPCQDETKPQSVMASQMCKFRCIYLNVMGICYQPFEMTDFA